MRQVSIAQYIGFLIATSIWGILFYIGLWLAIGFAFRLGGLAGSVISAVALNHFAFGIGKSIAER